MDKDEVLALLKEIVEFAKQTHRHWDADEDMKVGKRVMALAGYMPDNYDPTTTKLHAAIKKLEQG